MNFSVLEVAAVLVTLVSGAVNMTQFILAKRAKSLHVADLDTIYSTSYRAIENVDLAIEQAKSNSNRFEHISSTKSTINSIRELCQGRTEQLENRKPILTKPWVNHKAKKNT